MNGILYVMLMTFESAKEEARIVRRLLEHIEHTIGGEIIGANALRIKAKCGCIWTISIDEDNIKCLLAHEITKCLSVFNHGASPDILYINHRSENLADPHCFIRLKEMLDKFNEDYEKDWNALLDIQKQSFDELPNNKLPHGHPDLEYGG